MSDFVTVAKVGAIEEGRGDTFTVGERLVAIFLTGGEYYAIDDLCPHMGASLGAGQLVERTVVCPWHAWRFDITDGTWCDNRRIKTDSFEVRVVGNDIQVRLREKEPPPARPSTDCPPDR